jgi:UDP-N-acetylmuramoylalanine--D-glutamate ligase
MHVLVIGLGATGEAVVADARAAGNDVTVIEDQPGGDAYTARARDAAASGATVLAAPTAAEIEAAVERVDLVVPSPGVAPDHRGIAAALARGVPVRSEVDVAVERLRSLVPAPRLVAVTGTNGKTTVTTMIAEMCAAGGLRTAAVGNIGPPIITSTAEDSEVVVAEVSTFQLEFTTDTFVPDVAVLLNVAKDHIDWHGSVEAYAAAKARVFAHQRAGDVLVVNADDAVASELAARAPGRVRTYTTGAPDTGAYGVRDGMLVGPQGPLSPVPDVRAAHDVGNALAAAATVTELGVDASAVSSTLGTWTGLPHRVQLVDVVDGVRYVDDSKATNGHAAASALEGFDDVVLIAGGRDRSHDLGALRRHAPRLRTVVAIGEAAGTVAEVFDGLVPVERATSMHDAVRAAAAVARAGDTVLLSPGCASLDWYPNYGARGDDFAHEVRLLAEVGTT